MHVTVTWSFRRGHVTSHIKSHVTTVEDRKILKKNIFLFIFIRKILISGLFQAFCSLNIHAFFFAMLNITKIFLSEFLFYPVFKEYFGILWLDTKNNMHTIPIEILKLCINFFFYAFIFGSYGE